MELSKQGSLIVGKIIGVGGYGNVYQARWEDREVAIKQFNVTHAEAITEEAIQREIQLLASLRDKHIIQFYGTTQHEGRLVLVTEYAKGGNLQRAIQQRRLDWPNKARIADEIARGLAYIHHKGVLHRDLKSQNVLLTLHMEVKLCDFGFATVKVRSASMTGSLKGTHRWMAPELFVARPKYSTKSDMYALGMVMWEMAANCTKPFEDQLDNFTVMAIVMQGEREELPADTPPEYRMWVERCWSHDPNNRPEAKEVILSDAVHSTAEDPGVDVSTLSLSIGHSRMSIPQLPGGGADMTTNEPFGQSPHDVESLRTRANAHDLEAQMSLAVMYEKGIGVDQNDSEAFKCAQIQRGMLQGWNLLPPWTWNEEESRCRSTLDTAGS
ncbi:hypothetical protein BGZ73_006608 [Actinomortierella ambigua]|nr:hypothetical protein BGZ73_006608 [Actinomortierella ambigua]